MRRRAAPCRRAGTRRPGARRSGLPNCSRSLAYSTAYSSAARARPVAPRRERDARAVERLHEPVEALALVPQAPVVGRRTASSRKSSVLRIARWPILRIGGRTRRPRRPSRRRTRSRRCGACRVRRSRRRRRTRRCRRWRSSSSARRGRSRRRPASRWSGSTAASEPAPGSVVASAVSGGLSPVSGSIQRRFCSSVPSASTGSAKKPPEVTRLPIPEQPRQSSSWTMQPVRQSVMPPPPYSSGSMNDVSPSPAALCQTSHGDLDVGLVDGGEIGRISRAAKSRQSAGSPPARGRGRTGCRSRRARHARHRTGAADRAREAFSLASCSSAHDREG